MVTRDIVQRLLNVINDTRRRVNTLESREYVLLNATQTLTNKTLTTPAIGDFSNAQHSHADAAGGGQLSLTNAVSGVLPPANGGTGVNNDTRTLTINTNSGTLAFSGAGYTLTIPKTGTVPVGTGTAGRIAEWVTDANTVQASTLAKTGAGVLTLAAAANYTLTIPETGTAALLATENTFTANQTVTKSSRPTLRIEITGQSNKARFEAATTGYLAISQNATFSGVGSGWNLDNESLSGWLLALDTRNTADGNMVSIANFPAGVNPRVGVNIANFLANGNVGIGTASPSAQLHINQSSASGAKPTLRLRQAHLTEEFIRFDTTVGAGNPINTTALGAYYGRVRVWVEGVGAKWLALYNT